MDPRTAVVRAGYDRLGRRYAAWSARVEGDPRGRFVAELAARLPAGAPLVELGCGPGVSSTQLLAQRFRVLGIDLSQEQLRIARQNVPGAAFACADMAEVRFPDASFAAAVALYSIAHVPRRAHAALFARVARWLRPGGLFLAALAAGESPDWTGDWLGVPMFFSSHAAAVSRRLLAGAGLVLEHAEVVELREREGPVSFLWILARRRDARVHRPVRDLRGMRDLPGRSAAACAELRAVAPG
jgi:SAM-dependent methyltransferase